MMLLKILIICVTFYILLHKINAIKIFNAQDFILRNSIHGSDYFTLNFMINIYIKQGLYNMILYILKKVVKFNYMKS